VPIVKTVLSHYKLIILIIFVGLGITLQLTGTIDHDQLIAVARQYTDHWWLGVLLVAIQTLLFTFAMTGSSMIWITAALFTPVTSTAIMTAGTTLGAVSAYFFSERLSAEWTHNIKNTRIYKLLRKEGNFFILFALRMMPGFPHSIINYSSGILKLKFINFIPAAIFGTAVKTYMYSALIYNTIAVGALNSSIDVSAVWPLFLLSLFILAGVFIKRYLEK
jgi:uncharacterized membrane protein YdjX (TVP38/TMEM64 family)